MGRHETYGLSIRITGTGAVTGVRFLICILHHSFRIALEQVMMGVTISDYNVCCFISVQ
ncbi:hypothetical protein MKY42_10545 [Paenibacillus sp. FSL W7-1088]|uniref:hypothetical protein n=1 Tax=Paenibacillus sp. FSL W7-1088 TaxID=2921695 RepID=UPI0030EE6D5B